ncbi:hypothetical protein ASE06_21980 [Sphingopyxis sp. Root214]|nr:hypothetical protein ASE06_21980 [Sphingopyxis sp. Root214]
MHIGVMDGHRTIYPPHRPAGSAKPKTKFRLFAGNDCRVIALHLLQRFDPEHCVAAASRGLSHRRIPFAIAHLIIDAAFRVTLAPPPAYRRCRWLGAQTCLRGSQPARLEFTVAIDKLNIFDIGAAEQKCFEAGIARARGGEWHRQVKLDNMRSHRAGEVRASVG